MPRIAVLGLGRMGAAIATRLCAAGHDVTVWNRTPDKAIPLVAAGAKAAETPALAVCEAAYVISMLTGPDALEAVMDEAIPAIPDGCVLIEMSTVGPAAVHALVARLPTGVSIVDAPVMGSVDKARDGSLNLLVGGETPTVDVVRPLLTSLGTVSHCGPLGTGAAAKLVVNTGMITAVVALGETLALAEDLDLPADLVRNILAAGPLAGILGRTDSSTADFPIAHAAKDLDLAEAVTGDALPLVATANATLSTAIDDGLGDADLRAVLAHIRINR